MRQKIQHRKPGIVNESKRDSMTIESFQKTAHHQRLTSTHLAGNYHDSFLSEHAVVQDGQRLPVLRRRIEEEGIRTDSKGISRQSVIFSVHRLNLCITRRGCLRESESRYPPLRRFRSIGGAPEYGPLRA